MNIRSGIKMALAALGWTVAISVPAFADPASGSWVSFELVDIETWDEGRCTMVFFLERRIDMSAADGPEESRTGLYTVRHHGRFLRNDRGACRAPGQTRALGLFTNTRLWRFEADAGTRGSWVMRASFDQCVDFSCDSGFFIDDFESRLELRADGALLDLDNPNALGRPRAFWREAVISDRSKDVERGFDQIVRLISNGELERLTGSYLSPLSSARAEPARFAASLGPVQALLRKVASRQTIEVRVMQGMTSNDLGYAGDRYGVILRRLELEGSGEGIEVGVLHETRGSWKLLDAVWQ